MFENKTYKGIYYSRFVASWINSDGGPVDWRFERWMKTLKIDDEPIPDDVIDEIRNYGSNGKMELEISARVFIKRNGAN